MDLWDWILDLAADAWDAFADSLITLWEFLVTMFDFTQGFSIAGLAFGFANVLFIYVLRNYTLKPFTDFMPPLQRIFWTGATYVACLIVGYLVGQGLFSE